MSEKETEGPGEYTFRADKNGIPKGVYCYVFNGKNRMVDGVPHFGVRQCPHLIEKEYNGVLVPYCNFLKRGSSFDLSDADHAKLLEYFNGDEEAERKELGLSLLWDGCKECGENEDDYEENYRG
jgi:hypothetical protein